MRQVALLFIVFVVSACASSSQSSSTSKLSKYEGSGTDVYFRIQAQPERAAELEMAFIKQWPGMSLCFEHNTAADELDDLYFKITFLGSGRTGDLKSLRMTELKPSSADLKKCLMSELEKIRIAKKGAGAGLIELSMQPLGSKGGPALRFPFPKDERVIKK